MESIEKLCSHKDLIGYICGIGAGLAHVLGAACVQALNGKVPPFQLNAARYFMQIVLSLCIATFARKAISIPVTKMPWVIPITVFSILYNTFYFTAAEYLPLGNLSVTFLMVIYVAAVVLSKLFLDRNIHFTQVIVFLIVILGQFLLIQPCPPFSSSNCKLYLGPMGNESKVQGNTTQGNMTQPMPSAQFYYSFLGYSLGTGAAVIIAIRSFVYRIKVNEIPTAVLTLWTALLGLVTSLLLMVSTEEPVLSTSFLNLLLLAGHALLASTASTAGTNAQQVLHPIVCGILTNFESVYGFILQYSLPDVLLPGQGNWIEAIGVVIVLFGLIMFIVIDFRLKEAK